MSAFNLHKDWEQALKSELEQDYFKQLETFVLQQYSTFRCYPPKEQVFNAFNHCPLDKVKVVLLGQDPYHGPGQANGLSFSVNQGIKHPPSLVNIFKELQTDTGKDYPLSGDLLPWAEQGVLLLNASLSVREGAAGSHQKKGWERFTDQVISMLSAEKEQLVFMLWGAYAKGKQKLIDTKKHCVLTSGHPSPLSANRGHWFGNRHFSQCNAYLTKCAKTPINW